MKRWMTEAGLEHVEEKIINITYGKSNPGPEIEKLGVWSMTTGARAVCFAGKCKQSIEYQPKNFS